jgi:branched-chain amino acid transport system ATP-binding protein
MSTGLASDVATAALALDGVHAYYGHSHVLHGISLRLEEGKLLALLGRNGAGKSTTINCIAGLLPAREGSIKVFGRSIERLSPEFIARAGVRLVPQGRRIFPSLTVQENLAVAEQQREGKSPWTFSRVYELFPRLKERVRQGAGSLSGGEQQMLAIGRALMGNPKVLLMDEPSEGLAPLIVAEVGRAIEQIKSEGLSILLVEQNFKLALDLADEVVVINTGLVAFSGSAAAVRADNELVTQYLGVF